MHRPRARALTAALLLAIAIGASSAAAPAVAASGETSSHTVVAKKASAKSWAAKHYGTFTRRTYRGSGDAVLTLPKGAKAGIVKSDAHGDANFIVWTLNRNNSVRELVANGIGEYKATMAFGLGRKSSAKRMKVEADGRWTITVAPVKAAGSVTGKHADQGVYLYNGRAATVRTSNHGDGNFIVWQYGSRTGSMNLVVNEIGAKKSSGPLYRGPSVITVMSNGSWSASVR